MCWEPLTKIIQRQLNVNHIGKVLVWFSALSRRRTSEKSQNVELIIRADKNSTDKNKQNNKQ